MIYFECDCSYEGDVKFQECPIHHERLARCIDCQTPMDNNLWRVCNRCWNLADEELDTRFSIVEQIDDKN
jgi:hypothetical protein